MLPRQKIASVGYAFTAGNGVPKNAIIMWSGAIDQIPEGWALCDGTNGTPNLRDRFVVGAGNTYSVGSYGGETQHVLTLNELPAHSHVVDPPAVNTSINGNHAHTVNARDAGTNGSIIGEDNGNGTLHAVTTTTNGSHSHSIDIQPFASQSVGGGLPHNNLPPYYALAFIMKL